MKNVVSFYWNLETLLMELWMCLKTVYLGGKKMAKLLFNSCLIFLLKQNWPKCFFLVFWLQRSLAGPRDSSLPEGPGDTEVRTVHFTSGAEGVVMCWVKTFSESRGQGVIGRLHEYEIAHVHDVDSHSRQILSKLRLHTLSIFHQPSVCAGREKVAVLSGVCCDY